ncbi:MAG: C40 family peptidase [Actinobacteria bacterium]|nr:C40 family peptidase [Actinomycetota bacterium]
MRRVLVILGLAAVLCASAGSALAVGPTTAAQPSLDAAIARQMDADRHALGQDQRRQRALEARLRAARAKLVGATDPFQYDDTVGALQVDVTAAATRVAGLAAAIRRLHAALQPVQLPTTTNTSTSDPLGWDAVAVAEHYLGVRYLWGGSTPQSGFDCSGFVEFVYAQLGLPLAHYAATQFVTTPRIAPSRLEAGDLVFFEPHADGPGHVAIYIGDGELIQAPHTGAVIELAPLAELSSALGFVGATRPSELLAQTTA